MMYELNWKELMPVSEKINPRKVIEAKDSSLKMEGLRRRLDEKILQEQERVLRNSIKRTVVIMGMGLALITFMLPDCWAIYSPLFCIIGNIANLALILFGLIFLLFTGSEKVYRFSLYLCNAIGNPYRPALGIFCFFWIIALILKRFLTIKRFGYNGLRTIRWIAWIFTGMVWVIATFHLLQKVL